VALRPAASQGASPLRFALTPGGPASRHIIRYIRISPDGRRVLFEDSGTAQMSIRDLDDFESRVLPGTEGGRHPFFSPDGETIGFYADGKIRKVSIRGGDAKAICDNPIESPGAEWAPDGTIVFTPTWNSGLWKVPSDGGQSVQLTKPDRSKADSVHLWPRFLPDGRHVLFTIWSGSALAHAKIAVLDLPTGHTDVLFPGALATYLSTGHLLYFYLGAYHVVPFDPGLLKVTGAPRDVLKDVRPLDPLGSSESYVDVARDGRLVYVPGHDPRTAPWASPVWIDRRGQIERLPFADSLHSIALSPDDRRAAVARVASGETQIWIYDLQRKTRDQLTRDGSNFFPSWNAAGDRVAFTSVMQGSYDVRWAPADGSRSPAVLLNGDVDEQDWTWLPDGRSGVYVENTPRSGRDVLFLGEGKSAGRRTLVETPLDDTSAEVSPDGRWLAWLTAGTLYVARFPSMAERVQIAVGASTPHWSRGTREIFFDRGDYLYAAPYRIDATGRFDAGMPVPLFALPSGPADLSYGVSRDGSRFLFLQTDPSRESTEEIRVIDDGFAELARRN